MWRSLVDWETAKRRVRNLNDYFLHEARSKFGYTSLYWGDDKKVERRSEQDWHCLSLCDFRAWGLGRGLRDFVQQTVPITLYSVVPPDRPTAPAEQLRASGPPGFEMALV